MIHFDSFKCSVFYNRGRQTLGRV